MKSNIIYSRIDPQDWPQIITIENQIYPNPWPLKTMKACQNAGYQSIKGQYKNNPDIVCYGFMMIGFEEANLLNISVNPNYQRQGAASQLLHRFLLISRINQAKQLWLEVRENNHAAIKLYESFDFKPIGKRKNYYIYTNSEGHKVKEDAILMAKKTQ